MIGGQAGERRLVGRAERGLGLEGPADRVRRARAVDEAKGVDSVIGAVGETVGERRGGDMILIGAGFGMMREIGLHRGGIGLPVAGSGRAARWSATKASGVATGKIGVWSIAKRHISPSGPVSCSAMARKTLRPSVAKGRPPPVEKRPITAWRPERSSGVRDRVPAPPLASKYPVKQTPFAWARR